MSAKTPSVSFVSGAGDAPGGSGMDAMYDPSSGSGSGAGGGGGSSDAPELKPMTEEDIAELREIFNLVDKDGGGTISKAELAELMHTLGIRASSEEIELMVKEVDVDGSGEIEFSEFLLVMQRRVSVSYSKQDVLAAFKLFEKGNPPGYVRGSDLIAALQLYAPTNGSSGSKPTDERIAELVSQMEPDSSGLINYVDFVTMMMDN